MDQAITDTTVEPGGVLRTRARSSQRPIGSMTCTNKRGTWMTPYYYRAGPLVVAPNAYFYGEGDGPWFLHGEWIVSILSTGLMVTCRPLGFRAACDRADWLARHVTYWDDMTLDNCKTLMQERGHSYPGVVWKVACLVWTPGQADRHLKAQGDLQ